MKILITGGKSATALKLLKAFPGAEIILADYGEVPAFSSTAYQFVSLGEKNEDILAHNLLNHCLDQNVDVLLPLHDFELAPIAKTSILLAEFGITLLLPAIEFLPKYTKTPHSKKEWSLFNNGALVFTTALNDLVVQYAKSNELSGAYYHQDELEGTQLQLVKI